MGLEWEFCGGNGSVMGGCGSEYFMDWSGGELGGSFCVVG